MGAVGNMPVIPAFLENCLSLSGHMSYTCRIAAVVVLASLALPLSAQVQRNYLNPSFEVPALTASNPAAGCWKLVNELAVPGWATTHPSAAIQGDCTAPNTATGRMMELWRTGFGGVTAREGLNLAELNAVVSSRMYQNVCLINGESIAWRFSHRGRISGSAPDVAAYNVGASVPIVTVSTTNNGTMPAGTPVANQGTVNPVPAPVNGWRDYSGRFTYAGATGVTAMGFEAIRSANGNNSIGNLLDNIQIELRPFVEFVSSSSSTPESASNNGPTLRVNGTAFANFTVTIQITGGTATLGTDYTTPTGTDTFTVTIPGSAAGTQYDGVSATSLFALPMVITNDALVEANETISFRIVPPAGDPMPFLLNSSTTCGGTAQDAWLYTIADDDSALTVTKNSSAPVAVAGQPGQFDVSYTIAVTNTAATVAGNYALSDAPGFDVDASVVSASFSLNGGAATSLPAATPWTLQPQWRALAGGATDTWVLSVRFQVGRGGSVANDACVSPSVPGNGLHNTATATLQGTGGNPDQPFVDGACENTPTPAWVTLRKQLLGRAAATDQAQIRTYAGGTVAATATTTGSSVPATATTGLLVVAAGSTVQFDEAIKTNGTGADRALTGYKPSIACTNAGAPVVGGLPSGAGSSAGTRQIWPEFTGVAGADIDCTITNDLVQADLAITRPTRPA